MWDSFGGYGLLTEKIINSLTGIVKYGIYDEVKRILESAGKKVYEWNGKISSGRCDICGDVQLPSVI